MSFPFGPPHPPERERRCIDCGVVLEREMERDQRLCVQCQAQHAGHPNPSSRSASVQVLLDRYCPATPFPAAAPASHR